jgi:hypothetical protein
MDEGDGTVDTFHSIEIMCVKPSKFTKCEVEMDFRRENGSIYGNNDNINTLKTLHLTILKYENIFNEGFHILDIEFRLQSVVGWRYYQAN